MKKIYLLLLTAFISGLFTSCQRFKDAPLRAYSPLESTVWRTEATWGGWIRYFSFSADGTYETVAYHNDAGTLADVDKDYSSFSVSDRTIGSYSRDYSQPFYTYDIYGTTDEYKKVHVFYTTRPTDHYGDYVGFVLEFGNYYDECDMQIYGEEETMHYIDRFNNSYKWEVEKVSGLPTSDRIYYDGRPYGGSGSGGSGGSGGGGSSSATEGQVTATVVAIGPGAAYSSYAQYVDGKTTTITWIYREASGKYYIYGGTYCSDPDANGGKGVLYPCDRGYNSVRVDGGYAKDAYGNTQFYDINLRFTIP